MKLEMRVYKVYSEHYPISFKSQSVQSAQSEERFLLKETPVRRLLGDERARHHKRDNVNQLMHTYFTILLGSSSWTH